MPLRIVYIDDESDLCQVFVDNFASDDIQILTFTDPVEAVRFIANDVPDLVFIDYRLPKTTGIEIAKLIATSIPKVLISGDLALNPSPEFVRTFGKPFNFTEIEAFIQGYVDKKKTL
ncbi:MAG: response regulator [Proteobacteria bacterium]|nr:response regulator [Pseudomonadota bacterium]